MPYSNQQIVIINCLEPDSGLVDSFVKSKNKGNHVDIIVVNFNDLMRKRIHIPPSTNTYFYLFAHGDKEDTDTLWGAKGEIDLTKLGKSLASMLSGFTAKNYSASPVKPSLTLIICHGAGNEVVSFNSVAAKLHKNLGEYEVFLNVKSWIQVVAMTGAYPGKKFTVSQKNENLASLLIKNLANSKSEEEDGFLFQSLLDTFQCKQPFSKYTFAWCGKNADNLQQIAIANSDPYRFFVPPKETGVTKELVKLTSKL